MTSLTIIRPDDWHLHVRDGPGLASVVPHTAEHFGRAIIMPNLVPPVTTTPMVGSVCMLSMYGALFGKGCYFCQERNSMAKT